MEKESGSRENKLSCLQAALRILTSPKSSHQLREYLVKKGYEEDEISKVIEELKEKRLLNDERMFYHHCDFLYRKKHFGRMRMRYELVRLFGKELIDELFVGAIEEYDFKKTAVELTIMFFKAKTANDIDVSKKDSVARHLALYGFSAEEIRYAVNYVISLKK